jgi:hypothetical protein
MLVRQVNVYRRTDSSTFLFCLDKSEQIGYNSVCDNLLSQTEILVNSHVQLRTGSLMRQSAVALELGVHPKTIGRWTEDPDLDFPRPLIIKGRYFYLADQIEAWRDRQAAHTDAPAGHTGERAPPQPAQTPPEPDSDAEAAAAFLKATLADGQWHTAYDIEAAASDVGITREDLARGRHKLGVDSRQAPGCPRKWSLPDAGEAR